MRRSIAAVLLAVCFAASASALEDARPRWAEVERLISEEKLNQASERVDAILAASRAVGMEEDWTRALIQGALLRDATERFEGAVRLFQERPWPEGAVHKVLLNLFYARSLDVYGSRLWMERRERIASREETGIELWTPEQIGGASLAALREAWSLREELGDLPLSRFRGYLIPNDYPEGIRDTLRDALTYLYIEKVRPEEAVAALRDLESWHQAAGRREAALEAKLEGARRRHGSLDREEDRKTLRQELKKDLEAFRDLPWWSMGMAVLADLEQEAEEPGRLRRAREIALAGREGFPGSLGAERCQRLVEAIEAQAFRLEAMSSDGLGRRSIQATHRNLPRLHFRAYGIDPRRSAETRGWYPRGEDVEALLRDARPAAEWRVDLPATPDFESHVTWVIPPMSRPGLYLVVASILEDFSWTSNAMQAVVLQLGDLTLLVDGFSSGDLGGLALSGATGEPLEGVRIFLYEHDRSGGERTRLAGETVSGPDGSFRFPGAHEKSYSLIGQKAEETALLTGLGRFRVPEPRKLGTLLYTDRAVYRPGQKVLWKTLAWRGSPEDGFTAARGETVTVTLVSPDGRTVETRTVPVNDFGTASGEFVLPAGLLGGWGLRSEAGDPKACSCGGARLQVEEYKRPTFEVSLEPGGPLRTGHPARIQGKALYHFGLPVVGGEVRWTVKQYKVGGEPPRGYLGQRSSPPALSGVSALAPDGSFEISFTPGRQDEPGEWTWWVSISAEVTDEGGETRSAERTVRIGRASIEAAVATDAGFLPASLPASLTVVRGDLNGLPRSGIGRWTLYELHQPERILLPAEMPPLDLEPAELRTPGDLLSPRWRESSPEERMRGWENGRRVQGGGLRHGEDGRAEVRLPELRPGAYRLVYETEDDFGSRVEARRELIVAGERASLALPAVLALESPMARVGGTVRLLAHSGIPGQRLFLEIFRNGEVIERRRLRGGEGTAVVEIPVREADRGGFGVKLLALRDHQLFERSAQVRVPWDDRELIVRLSRFRDRVRPGTRETFRVTVRTPDGTPPEAAAAELLASMSDRSLDLIEPYEPPNALAVFPDRSWLPDLSSPFGQQGLCYQSDGRATRQDRYLRGDRLRSIPPVVSEAIFGDLVSSVDGAAPPDMQTVRQTVTVIAKSPRLDERRVSLGCTVALGPVPTGSLAPPVEPTSPLRRRFDETALWRPHLLTGPDGTATIELTVPDSVTVWSLWVHALTRDLRMGSAHAETRSVRDLTVRPVLPRFLREGDGAELPVVVSNASRSRLRGEVTFDLLDPETGESRLADFGVAPGEARLPFDLAAGGSAGLSFPVAVPPGLGAVQVKVTAAADGLTDGELRELPVLPARVHLAQSRFAALEGKERRSLTFSGGDDPTRVGEKLVVTVDGQLFDGVLRALPYLTDYPYECTEQTLNRFLSTGIVTGLFDRYPAVARRAAELAERETPLETWDAADPNRKVALEETPFLAEARGGNVGERALVKVLDPRVARAEREAALAKLRQAQRPDGAFPWWPGGQASPYMTVYLLHGFARAAEAGLEVPRDVVQRAWTWTAGHVRKECGEKLDDPRCRELLVLLNYAASSYPDPSWVGEAFSEAERRKVLDATFSQWGSVSRCLRPLLALTLLRMGRPADARLVLDSVMDLARTTEEGTFWQAEERSWLWTNDTIEGHAFALLALMEVRPSDPRRHGLVRWLFLNKQLNHWRSTRATAEVLYALARYLEREGRLEAPEEVMVHAAGREETFRFEPDAYLAEARLVVPGGEIGAEPPRVEVEKETPGLVFATATWHFSTEEAPEADQGGLFGVSRRYFLRVREGGEAVLRPLEEGTVLRPGDEVEVQLRLRSRAPAEYVHVRDPRPAGLEPQNLRSGWQWSAGIFHYEETRDSGTNFYFESLPAGELTLRYRLQAATAGTFRAGPATVQSMYAPEFTAYSEGAVVRVEGRE
ncbi:MAG TPA: alpha-2-macroglobulin family protein [Thermoanaerobaculia bacterium]